MTKTKRISKEQRLRDGVAYAASCLKEAGDPLHNLGPSGQYEDVFKRYSAAMLRLVEFDCPIAIEEWSWDGYAGTFHFKWVFGAQVREPGAGKKDFETQFVGMYSYARLDPSKPLDEELTRLRDEAEHFHAMRNGVMMWSTKVAKGETP